MTDFEVYNEALDNDREEEYMSPFNRSLCLVMDEFYKYVLYLSVINLPLSL